MQCENCGRYMKLTDRLPDDEEFDDELAAECGLTEDDLNGDPFEPPLCNFRYVQDQWECGNCQLMTWHTEGPRYYYDPETNGYKAEAKPLTPKEKIALENKAQEDAGQLKLI